MEKILLLVFLLASVIQFHFGLDNSLIERDLYKDLGLTNAASLKDIKKAFRKLAQVHHPDKSKSSNREANEIIFREVAAAYEVLSDSSQRQEYDSMRKSRENRNSGGRFHHESSSSNQRYRRERQSQQHGYDYSSTYSNYDDSFADDSSGYNRRNDFPFATYRPSVANTILPATQVIFPYSPIIVSQDRQHFALLDIHCSLGVYKGDADVVIKHLIFFQSPPDLTMMPVELKFRTEGEPSLNGRCFAGLDKVGILRVYRGHPEYPDDSEPLWSSDPPADDSSDYNSYFQRFYLELSNTGELAVRMFVAGSSDSQCVWSTTSCNVYMALLKEMRGQVSQSLIEVFRETKELILVMKKNVLLIYRTFVDRDRLSALLQTARQKIEGAVSNLLKFIARRGDDKVGEAKETNGSSDSTRSSKDKSFHSSDFETGAQRRKNRQRAGGK